MLLNPSEIQVMIRCSSDTAVTRFAMMHETVIWASNFHERRLSASSIPLSFSLFSVCKWVSKGEKWSSSLLALLWNIVNYCLIITPAVSDDLSIPPALFASSEWVKRNSSWCLRIFSWAQNHFLFFIQLSIHPRPIRWFAMLPNTPSGAEPDDSLIYYIIVLIIGSSFGALRPNRAGYYIRSRTCNPALPQFFSAQSDVIFNC